MKENQDDKKDQKNPTSQKQNAGNQKNSGDSKDVKNPSSTKKNDKEEDGKSKGGSNKKG